MKKDNRASNARFLGSVIGWPMQIAHVDQYEPTRPLFIEETPTVGYTEAEQNCKLCSGPFGQCEQQETDPEELPDQDWASQKTEYEL